MKQKILLHILITLNTFISFSQEKRYEVISTNIQSVIQKLQTNSKDVEIDFPTDFDKKTTLLFTEEQNQLPKSLNIKYPGIKAFKGVSKQNKDIFCFVTIINHRIYGTLHNNGETVSFNNGKGDKNNELRFEKKYSISNNCSQCKDHENSQCNAKNQLIEKTSDNEYNLENKVNSTKTITSATYFRGNFSKTYRFAMAVTYAKNTEMGNTTVAEGLAYANARLTNSNYVFGLELAIHFEFIPNEDLLIFLDPSDPYPDSYTYDANPLLAINQTTLDNIIGNANYDWGFVFHPCFINWAVNRGNCTPSNKGRGVGDNDNLASHEMGHQLNGTHMYHLDNSSEIQKITTSIVGSNGGRWLHSVNFERAAILVDGNVCGTVAPTGNIVPSISIGFNDGLTIPIGTPFVLSGTGSDPDPNADLTYAWQHCGFTEAEATIESKKLLFAHKNPANNGQKRYIPDLPYLLSNTDDPSSNLPSVSRDIVTRFISRDNQLPYGATVFEERTIHTDATSGPFLVTYPNEYQYFTGGQNITVTWDVANTNNAIVNAQQVNILLTIDQGVTWTTLASNVSNNGSYLVTIPNTPSTQCRIKIEAANNIFFDISNKDFVIVSNSTNDFAFYPIDDYNAEYNQNSSVFRFNFTKLGIFTNNVNVVVTGEPSGSNLNFATSLNTSGDFNVNILNADAVTPGKYILNITLTENGGSGISKSLNFTYIKQNIGNGTSGSALSFINNSQNATVQILPIQTNTFTLSAWIKPTAGLTYCGFLFFGSDTGLNIDDNGFIRYHYKGTSYWSYNGNVSIAYDKWNHITLVIEPSKASIYLNGKLAAERTAFHALIPFEELRIGRQYPTSRRFVGQIDEVRIYNKSLTPQEVQEDVHRTSNYYNSNLVNYFQFNEVSGNPISPVTFDNAVTTSSHVRVASTIPSGDANVATLDQSTTLTYFPNTDIGLLFNNSNNEQKTTVHKINQNPNTLNGIDSSLLSSQNNSYWEINNYSPTNTILNAEFKVENDVAPSQTPANYYLYTREQNSDNNWIFLQNATSIDPATDKVVFQNIPSNGQYLVYYSNSLNTPYFESYNNVLVYKNEGLNIISNIKKIQKIDIYDVLGRRILEKNNIDSNASLVTNINTTQNLLFVKVTLEDNTKVIKKIFF